MKLKVFTYSFSIPFIWATFLSLQIIAPDFGLSRLFPSGILSGLFIGSLISRFFLDRKYLTDIFVDDEKICLTYLNPFAKQYQKSIQLSTLADINLKDKLFLIRDFNSIKFSSGDKKITFYLLNHNLKPLIEQLIEAYPDKSVLNNT